MYVYIHVAMSLWLAVCVWYIHTYMSLYMYCVHIHVLLYALFSSQKI